MAGSTSKILVVYARMIVGTEKLPDGNVGLRVEEVADMCRRKFQLEFDTLLQQDMAALAPKPITYGPKRRRGKGKDQRW